MSRRLTFLLRNALQALGLEVRRTRRKQTRHIYSNFNEQTIIKGYLTSLGMVERGCCVDIAAGDGMSMSNTYSLYQEGWRGLAVELDEQRFQFLAENYADLEKVNLARCKVTPKNVLSLLAANEIPESFDFLNLDMDGYDYYVLKEILTRYRPKLICAEINEKIPPPIKFTVQWDPAYVWPGNNFYGQSISQLADLAMEHDYSLAELHYNNAFLVPSELNPATSLSAEEAYQAGYRDKADRLERFPWNKEIDAALYMQPDKALIFIKNYFRKYKGMFLASI